MRSRIGMLIAATAVVLTLSTGPAQAAPPYPGAGFVVAGVSDMKVDFRVPTIRCAPRENTAIINGLISPAIGQLPGWNATVVVGCATGQPWYRIQTWVNAVGGGHTVYPTSPGNLIRARLLRFGGYVSSPEIRVTDYTTNHRVSNRMNPALSPAAVAAAGVYGGSSVVDFDRLPMSVHVNGKALGDVARSRLDLKRGRTVLVKTGYIGNDAMTYTLYFQHA